jgi:hypothetical protein
VKEKDMGNYPNMAMKGDNQGCGNRAAAAHVKNLHEAARLSGSVSSTTKPARRSQPGAPASALKSPRATKRPRD